MKILLVEPRPARAQAVADLVRAAGALEVETVRDATSALARLGSGEFGALASARWLPALGGASLAALARTLQKGLETVVYEDPEQERGILEDLARRCR